MSNPTHSPDALEFRSSLHNRTRPRRYLILALTSLCVLGYACKAPGDVGPESRPLSLSVERDVLPDTGDSFYVRGGTLTSTGGFFLSSGRDSVCGSASYEIFTGQGTIESPEIEVCGPSSLDAERRVVLDGGYVEIKGAVNADTTDIGPVDGSWDQELQLYNPTVMTAVLTAHPFGGYHFADWTIKTVGDQYIRTSTSLTLTRAAGSNERRFEAYFQQNAQR